MRFYALILLLTYSSWAWGQGAQCTQFFPRTILPEFSSFRSLFDPQIGFSIVEARPNLSKEKVQEIYRHLRQNQVSSIQFQGISFDYTGVEHKRGAEYRPINSDFIDLLENINQSYISFARSLSPEFRKLNAQGEVRVWTLEEGGRGFPTKHRDGTYLTVLVPLIGPGPIIYVGQHEITTQEGQVTFLSGTFRVKKNPNLKPTEHSSPGFADRLVLVIQFYSPF